MIDEGLLGALKRAERGYKAAIDALPYMPAESKKYTRQTADRYQREIRQIKRSLQS